MGMIVLFAGLVGLVALVTFLEAQRARRQDEVWSKAAARLHLEHGFLVGLRVIRGRVGGNRVLVEEQRRGKVVVARFSVAGRTSF